MKYSKLLTLTAFAALAVPFANAATISPQQALQIARNFLSSSPVMVSKSTGNHTATMNVTYTAKSARTTDNLLYVVSRGNNDGFVVVAGDDAVANPVLGYSVNGTFNYDQAPDNLKCWLDEYSRLIDYMDANNMELAPVKTFGNSVEPLIKTLWDQCGPYNNLCPTIDGSHTWTGCVATAMSQLMKFHEWPKQGVGSHSYSWNGETQSADFGSTTYQWDLMLDEYEYDSHESNPANDAVATLMHHCGVAVEMKYGLDGSSASSRAVPAALVEYFGYARDIEYKERNFYSYDEWLSMLKAEIDARRPVYYSAKSSGGGHAFLIDGYNADGYFHVNWGWSGISNGYYQIATLIPGDEQGAGAGSDSGYMYSQGGIFNVHIPDGSETTVSKISAYNFSITDLNGSITNTLNITKGERFGLYFEYVQNSGTFDFTGRLGYIITDDKGNNVYENLTLNINDPLPPSYYYPQLSTTTTMPANLGDGHYRIYPAYAAGVAGEPQIMPASTMGNKYADITVQGNNVTLATQPTLLDQLSIDNLIVVNNDEFQNSDEYAAIYLDITNHGTEYYNSEVYALLLDDSGMVAYPSQETHYKMSSYVMVPPGETRSVALPMLINDFARDNDVYYIAISDANFGRLLGNYRAAININNPEIAIKGTPAVIDGNSANLTLTAAFENTSSSMFYAGQIGAMIFDSDHNLLRILDVRQMEIAAGKESGTVTFNGRFPEGSVGDKYLIYFYDNATPLYPPIEFTKEPAGMNNTIAATINATTYPNPVSDVLNITAATAIRRVDVYGITGTQVASHSGNDSQSMQIDMSHLAAGAYFVRIATENGTETVKIMKN